MLLETVAVKDGRIMLAGLHDERMRRSALEMFGHGPGFSLDDVKVPAEFCRGLVKLRIVYGDDSMSYGFSRYVQAEVSSLAVVCCDSIDYHLKYEDRSELEALRKMRGERDDVLIVKNGFVTDTSFSNVVLRRGDELVTPDTFLLDGCMRRHLLESGIIRERRVMLEDLPGYDEIFLINSMLDLSDVKSIKTFL